MKNFLKNLLRLAKMFALVFIAVLFVGFTMIFGTCAIDKATNKIVNYWEVVTYFVGAVTCLSVTMTMLIAPLHHELED